MSDTELRKEEEISENKPRSCTQTLLLWVNQPFKVSSSYGNSMTGENEEGNKLCFDVGLVASCVRENNVPCI